MESRLDDRVRRGWLNRKQLQREGGFKKDCPIRQEAGKRIVQLDGRLQNALSYSTEDDLRRLGHTQKTPLLTEAFVRVRMSRGSCFGSSRCNLMESSDSGIRFAMLPLCRLQNGFEHSSCPHPTMLCFMYVADKDLMMRFGSLPFLATIAV